MSIIEEQRKRYKEKFKPDESFTDLNEAYEETRSKRNPDLIKDFSADNKNIDPKAIPDTEGFGSAADAEAIEKGLQEIQGNNYGIVGDTIATAYNAPKTMADLALQTLPMAETILNPMGEYSGVYDYFKNLGSTELENKDFIKISKNQINNPDIVNYLESYKKDYALDETKVVDHINSKLGLDIISVEDLVTKYKGNKEVADAVSTSVKEIEGDYLTQDDWKEDEDFYYIKNFKEIPMGVNLAWTKHGDLQMPNYGIFKFDEDGQGSMMRHSATNLKDSWNPVTSLIGEQGFGSKPEHTYGVELYGDQGAQAAGFGLGSLGLMFTPQGARSAMSAPGMWNKAKGVVKSNVPLPTTAKGAAGAGGITSIQMAGYFDVIGE